jgi:hypothetical protein
MRRAQKRAAYGLTALLALLFAAEMVALITWMAQ